MENFDQKIKNKLFSLDYDEAPNKILMSGMFEQLDKKQENKVPVMKMPPIIKTRNLYSKYLRVAATIVIFLVAGFSIYKVNEVNLHVNKGIKLTHHLPDGSSVKINADSKLAYNKLSWFFNRSVSLEGEAFFEVVKGEKFTVSSKKGNTLVLGTSFNIYSRAQDYKVECVTGRVKVSYLGGTNTFLLTSGNGVEFNNAEKGRVYSTNNENIAAWRSGEFHFDNEPLKNVFATLSRQYNIEVRLNKKYEQNKYTGYFNDNNLDTALKLICDPSEIDYQIMDEYILVK